MPRPPLSNQRYERFAQEVASGKAATEAYVLAGGKAKGRDAIKTAAQALFNKPEVAARIEELQSAGAALAEVKAADVVRELARIAFFDPRTMVRWTDAQTEVFEANPDDLDDEAIAALEEEVKEGKLEKTPEGLFRKTVVIQPGVHLVNSDEVSADTAAAIHAVEQTASGLKVKFHSKISALEMLGKYLQMWSDNQASQGKPFAITDQPLSNEAWLDIHADKTQH